MIVALLTPRDVAARLALSHDSVLTLIHAGKLRAVNVGLGRRKGRYRVRPEDLAEFVAGREIQPPARRGRRPKPTRPEGWVSYFGGRAKTP